MDNFISLTNRLINRAPQVGIVLAGQLVNDAWKTLQARKDWSWRRKSGSFNPPTLYQAGTATTNVGTGNPYLITGSGTAWDQSMIGRQIRVGGLNFPYYTISSYISPTSLLIDQPWAGPDQTAQNYQILQCFYPVPEDFGYFEWLVSVKDGFKLFTDTTQSELAVWDPQRTNTGQTFVASYRDFSSLLGGFISPVISVTNVLDPAPISTTTLGYSYPANATFIIQVVTTGVTGVATYQWMKAGQTSWQPTILTANTPQDLSDGVQIYWPDVSLGLTWDQATQSWQQYSGTWQGAGSSYAAGDIFIINCTSNTTQGSPRYELWPTPTYSSYIYPYQYMTRETELSELKPSLPPPIASRGEVILEMALEKCALFPGADMDHPNPYFSLQLASYHRGKYEDMLIDLLNNDQNIGLSNITYDSWPYAGGVWNTGQWQQSHAPLI